MAKRGKRMGDGPGAAAVRPKNVVEDVTLAEATRSRYLNYALSVITSRALPDVRDGLKPVQRRILYAMWADLHITSDSRYMKSAAVVGEVMKSYHPHGDQSIYDALVRMAQPFSLRHTLVEGYGNFGSIDGDRWDHAVRKLGSDHCHPDREDQEKRSNKLRDVFPHQALPRPLKAADCWLIVNQERHIQDLL